VDGQDTYPTLYDFVQVALQVKKGLKDSSAGQVMAARLSPTKTRTWGHCRWRLTTLLGPHWEHTIVPTAWASSKMWKHSIRLSVPWEAILPGAVRPPIRGHTTH